MARYRVGGDFLATGWVEVDAVSEEEAMTKAEESKHWLDKDDTQPHSGFSPQWIDDPETTDAFITCKFCGELALTKTAHMHDGTWVGECCWIEQLRSSE